MMSASPRAATSCCATTRDTPIVASGSSIAITLRYTTMRIVSTINTVAISMMC